MAATSGGHGNLGCYTGPGQKHAIRGDFIWVNQLFRDLVDGLDDCVKEPEIFLDVPFVPTEEAVVEAMLNLADVGRHDVLYDLGAGDGRFLVAAAMRRKARGVGIELDPARVADAMEYAAHSRVEHLVDFIEEDFFKADYHDATVVVLYLLDSINVKLRPRLLKTLQAGARIVSHAFDMGDWRPDERVSVAGSTLYKWIVPARVAGTWYWESLDGASYRAELRQKYQDVSAQVWREETPVCVKSADLQGGQLDLHLDGTPSGAARHFTLHFETGELVSAEEHAADGSC
ncbi:class I SAM-dependent methyltransferase [Castellaniella sp.]|uniref:class I SAM-dependent methyltransferase n=1 Tax=Castellaniella sp. TaxID=1955812 RepID=UPI003564D280